MVTIQQLTTLIYEQAKARAILNEITELTQKQLELEERAKLYENYKVGTRTVKELSEAIDEANKKGQSVRLGANEQEYVNTYRSIMSEVRGLQNQINALTGQIDPSKLLDDATKGTKDALDKITDYYWEWVESNAKIIKDAEDRDIALNDVKYEKAKDTYQKILDEQKAAGTLTAEQEKYLTDIILNLETERQQSRLAIIDKYYKQLWEEIRKGLDTSVIEEYIDEEDVSISGKYEKMLANISTQIINARASLNDSLLNGSYEEAKQEGSILNDLLREKLEKEREYQKALLQMRYETGELTQDQYAIELANVDAAIDKSIAKLKGKQRRKVDIWDLLFGSKQTDEYGNVFKKLDDESKAFIQELISGLQTAMQYMDEFMDKRIEMAEIAVEAAQRESEAAKTNLDYEMEARANGYAHNVDLARREYEEKLAIEQKAIEEKQRLQKIQEGIDTATQISSLVTATAQIWAAYTKIPAGKVLAIAATALMWSSFAAAKVQAAQLANAKTYGEGGMEYIDYGGSHASGRDVDFGRTKEGRPRRVEKGEVVSVINKKNVEKYGVSNIENIVNSLNNGTFEKQYISSRFASTLSKSSNVVESTERNTLGDMYSLAFSMLGMPSGDSADLSTIERGISTLVSQNDVRVVPTPYGRIEYRGNNTRIIRNS